MKNLTWIIAIVLLASCQIKGENDQIKHWEKQLTAISQLQKTAQTVHPLFCKLYPIALVEKNSVYIFTADNEQTGYRFSKKAESKIAYSKGIRAAFPLEENDWQTTCVVSPEAFNNLKDRILIFHEFVHCYQAETCEQALKTNLQIYREEMAQQHYMWEIDYPFPYETIADQYHEYLTSLENGKIELAASQRQELRSRLSLTQEEYLVWQEWKEGSARYLENKLNLACGLERNDFGLKQDFSRITFYAGGERLISLLTQQNSELLNDFAALYQAIDEFGKRETNTR
ncbi:MAG: hypothetical protein Q7J16_09880 [Candidatus Cloacimonadales bacterium]|nr:hypothetical protein [Candidatus Cloacimonadales bacterium]